MPISDFLTRFMPKSQGLRLSELQNEWEHRNLHTLKNRLPEPSVETVGEKPKETIARLTELSQSLKDINKVLSVDKKQDQETTQTDSSYSSGASTNGTDEKLSKLTVQYHMQ